MGSDRLDVPVSRFFILCPLDKVSRNFFTTALQNNCLASLCSSLSETGCCGHISTKKRRSSFLSSSSSIYLCGKKPTSRNSVWSVFVVFVATTSWQHQEAHVFLLQPNLNPFHSAVERTFCFTTTLPPPPSGILTAKSVSSSSYLAFPSHTFLTTRKREIGERPYHKKNLHQHQMSIIGPSLISRLLLK